MGDWVNFQDWLALNEGDANKMADKLSGDINAEGADAQQKIGNVSGQAMATAAGTGKATDLQTNPGYGAALGAGMNAARDANALGTSGGQQAALQRSYGGNVSAWDAAAAGAAGGQQFSDLQKRWGSLPQQLGIEQQRVNDFAKQRGGEISAQNAKNSAAYAQRQAAMGAAAQQQQGHARYAEGKYGGMVGTLLGQRGKSVVQQGYDQNPDRWDAVTRQGEADSQSRTDEASQLAMMILGAM